MDFILVSEKTGTLTSEKGRNSKDIKSKNERVWQ